MLSTNCVGMRVGFYLIMLLPELSPILILSLSLGRRGYPRCDLLAHLSKRAERRGIGGRSADAYYVWLLPSSAPDGAIFNLNVLLCVEIKPTKLPEKRSSSN